MAPGVKPIAQGCGYLAADNLLSGLEARREYTASIISASR